MTITIRNRSALTQSFIPLDLPHRKIEIEKIKENVIPKVFGSNLYLQGSRGCGKTVTVKYVLQEFKATYPDAGVFYFDLTNIKSVKELLFKELFYLPKYRREIPELLNRCPQKAVVVYDDISKVYSQADLDRLILSFYSLTEQKGFEITQILISNLPFHLYEKKAQNTDIHESMLSRMQFHPIVFSRYMADQISDIIRGRLFIALDGLVDEGFINYISAKTYRLGSDMRLAMDVVLNAIQIALEKDQPLTDQLAQRAWQLEKTQYWKDDLLALPPHQLLLLKCAYESDNPTTTKVIDAYNRTCNRIDVKPLSPRQLRRHIAELAQKGFIEKEERFMPSKGSKVYIELGAPPEDVKRALREIDLEEIML